MNDPENLVLALLRKLDQKTDAMRDEMNERFERIETDIRTIKDEMQVTTGMAMRTFGTNDAVNGLIKRMERFEKRLANIETDRENSNGR
ncbi:MAG: hypothetical protein H6851_07615 [Geminicoccaceae bacterium]|nr:hypothetical protein [Geminicoccaceae bacterium]